MSGETPKVRNPGGMLGLQGMVILLVLYLYYQVVKNYLAGGPDAPSLATVVVGGIVLIGGCIGVGCMAFRIYRQATKKLEEAPGEDQEK